MRRATIQYWFPDVTGAATGERLEHHLLYIDAPGVVIAVPITVPDGLVSRVRLDFDNQVCRRAHLIVMKAGHQILSFRLMAR